MKDIISPIDTADGLFHDGDPSTSAEGTVVYAKWLNAMQGAMIDTQTEHKNILAAAGMQPKAEQNTQITEAINSLILQSLKEDSRQSLLKKNNGADIPDKTAFVKNLGLSNTIEQAQNALDKRTGGTVTGSLHVTQAVHVGDNDSGLRANGDGNVAFYASNTKVAAWNNDRLHWIKNIETGGSLIAGDSVKTGKGQTTLQPDGNIHGPVWGGHLSGWIEKRIHESSAFWVDGNNWWRKDFRAGIEFITQGGFVEGDGDSHRRVNLHANVPHRLLYVSITTMDFGQPEATWNHQVKDLSNERDGFEWFHGWQERKMYWMAVGY
ncbi:hypothetical protein AAH678_18900 [Sodalis endosymbiont of Spalangia cameroni]|uniref:hypothetical protein n=1 Tax=Sodalis praecaptivus TaxID=1239307 RepID=UPI0031F9D0E5